MEMTAIKRNERTDSINMDKIHHSIQEATKGIEGIDASELEMQAELYFKDSLGTQDMAQTLVRMAVDKSTLMYPTGAL